MSQLVLGGMAKGHELIQQLVHSRSRTLSLSLYYNYTLANLMYRSSTNHDHRTSNRDTWQHFDFGGDSHCDYYSMYW